MYMQANNMYIRLKYKCLNPGDAPQVFALLGHIRRLFILYLKSMGDEQQHQTKYLSSCFYHQPAQQLCFSMENSTKSLTFP